MAVLQTITVPLLAVNDTSLSVVELSFANGAAVHKGDRLMVFETSKTTYEVEADAAGYIHYLCELDHDYEVGKVVAEVLSEPPVVTDLIKSPPAKPVEIPRQWEGEPVFSGAALQLMQSSHIDKSRFNGMDLVSVRDVEQVLGIQKPVAAPAPIQPPARPAVALTATTFPVDQSNAVIEKLASSKRKEAEYLSAVQSAGLTSTIHVFVDTEGLQRQFARSLKYLKDSLLPVLIYETARLLKKYPMLNGYFAGEGKMAVYKEVNLGFAVDIDKGLKVLKVPAANTKNLLQLEAAIMELSGRYLDDKLSLDDITDISFTITDLSGEGVAFFRPLVNMMNSAILGISAIDNKLNRCTLSLTFDHRVTEGKTVARFLNELKERLESYRPSASELAASITCFKCLTPLSADLSDTGFVSCIKPDGQAGYICQRCFNGI